VNDLCRDTLGRIVANFGHQVWADPDRCEALIREFCEGYDAEAQALVTALRRKVPGDLLEWSRSVPPADAVARLTARLQASGAMFPASAKWAVESWALALGVIKAGDLAATQPEPAVAIQAAWRQESRPAASPAASALPPPPEKGSPIPKVLLMALPLAGLLMLVLVFAILRLRSHPAPVAGPAHDTWEPSQAKVQFALVRTWDNDTGTARSILADASGGRVAVFGSNGMTIWDVTSEPPSGTKVAVDRWGGATLNPAWDSVARGTSFRNGSGVGVYPLDGYEPALEFEKSGGRHRDNAFDSSGRFFKAAIGGRVGTWNARTGAMLADVIFTETAWARSVFLPGGDRFALFNAPVGKVRLFQTETGTESGCQDLGPGAPIATAAAFQRDGGLAAIACNNGTIWVLGMEPLCVRAVIPGYFDHVQGLAFRPGGRQLVSVDRAGRVQIWDIEATREIGRLLLEGAKSPCFALGPDGESLYVPGEGAAIRRLKILEIW
jgi:hypothetical protein